MVRKKWPPCDVCGQAVRLSEGMLGVDKAELERFETKNAKWEQEHPGDIIKYEEIMTSPESVKWHWGHVRCIPDTMYEIEANSFGTVSKALGWTLHLMEKDWVSNTNWNETVRRFHIVE
jgi:hypothetical protein